MMEGRFSVVVLLFLSACLSVDSNPTSTSIEESVMPPIRYLALGDSYTIGESVDESERWPNQLAEMLNKQGYQTDVTIIALGFWIKNRFASAPQPASLNLGMGDD